MNKNSISLTYEILSFYIRVLTVTFITWESIGTKSTCSMKFLVACVCFLLPKNSYIDGRGTGTDNAVIT